MAKLSLFTRSQDQMDNGQRIEVGPVGQKFGITTRGLTDAYHDAVFSLRRAKAIEINSDLGKDDLPVSPDTLPPSAEDRIMAEALAKHCLLGVDSLEDDDGSEVKFDAFCKMLFLRENQPLLSLSYTAARSVGLARQGQKESAVKN